MNVARGPTETVALTVGTAGHIDHGKTALVKLLTGCDTDTLPEEKARGMTIDLGFATCTLPDDRRVGIVDVPGHERFIHNMVAGAAGIDVVLLVVAADDGVMPQTIEHFHIVRLLGVKAGMVAVTKADLAAEARIGEVCDDVRTLVAGSFLEGCPIVPISAKTGAGFEWFYNAFVATVDRTARHDISGPFCMHVERSFVLKGLGTIVSGIPRSGAVRLGEELEILPRGERKRVRGIQVYGQDAGEGRAGQCVALRMADLPHEEAARGMVLATPGHFTPTRFIDARFHLLPGLHRPLKPRTAVRFHVGTADAPGHLVLPELTPLPPGGESYVQVQLERPVVAGPGDFFVVRMLSPVRTLGGGVVVRQDETKMRRGRVRWAEAVQEHEDAFRDPARAIFYVLDHAQGETLKVGDLARGAMLSEASVRECLGPLAASGAVVNLGGERYALAASVARAGEEVTAALNRMHGERPLALGFPKREVLQALAAPRPLVDKAMEDLLARGRVSAGAIGLFLPERAPRLSAPQQALADRLVGLYRDAAFSTPRRDEVPAAVGAPARVLDPILDFLIQRGDLVIVSDKVILHRERLEESASKLKQHFASHATIEPGEFKDLLGTTRKYTIPLLEYWDAHGLTKREGDRRVLRMKASGE